MHLVGALPLCRSAASRLVAWAIAGVLLAPAGCGTDVSDPTCDELPTIEQRRACSAAGGVDEQRCGDGVVSEYLPADVLFDFDDGLFPDALSGDWRVQRSDDDTTFVLTNARLVDNESGRVAWTTDVLVASELSFDLRVSSESCCDILRFFIDGVEQNQWAGDISWRAAEYDVAPGRRTFAWEYSKDFSLSIGLDAAFVDNIALIASEAVVEACDEGAANGGDVCSSECQLVN